MDLVFELATPGPVPEGGGEISYEKKVAFVEPIGGLSHDGDITFAHATNRLSTLQLHEVEIQVKQPTVGKDNPGTIQYQHAKEAVVSVPAHCFIAPTINSKK